MAVCSMDPSRGEVLSSHSFLPFLVEKGDGKHKSIFFKANRRKTESYSCTDSSPLILDRNHLYASTTSLRGKTPAALHSHSMDVELPLVTVQTTSPSPGGCRVTDPDKALGGSLDHGH